MKNPETVFAPLARTKDAGIPMPHDNTPDDDPVKESDATAMIVGIVIGATGSAIVVACAAALLCYYIHGLHL